MTRAVPFSTIPVSYERAFGGWDRSHPDAAAHEFEPRNPVGRGFFGKKTALRDDVYAPNVEDPNALIRAYSDRPPPAGLGFVSPSWQARAQWAGTYDERWREARAPLLPSDFDRRHFSAASTGLIASGYLRGDEQVRAEGLTRGSPRSFELPGIPPPVVRLGMVRNEDEVPSCHLDTLIIDLDRHKISMLWRAHLPLRNGPHDVRSIEFTCPAARMLPRADVETASAGPATASPPLGVQP
ncbi:MAG: DUF2169 domain-containing protein [Nannocystaceae bacterium]